MNVKKMISSVSSEFWTDLDSFIYSCDKKLKKKSYFYKNGLKINKFHGEHFDSSLI